MSEAHHRFWELLTSEAAGDIITERMEVPGGWLYRTLTLHRKPPYGVAMVFVPYSQAISTELKWVP